LVSNNEKLEGSAGGSPRQAGKTTCNPTGIATWAVVPVGYAVVDPPGTEATEAEEGRELGERVRNLCPTNPNRSRPLAVSDPAALV
jgi:hypothetical protein